MGNKTYSVYVHKVETENGPMYYSGMTSMELQERWRPINYKTTSLWPYIEQYGWNNIEHTVVFDTDDRENALKIEDMLICGYAALGRKINKQRSGLIKKNNGSDYNRILMEINSDYKDKVLEYNRQKYRRWMENDDNAKHKKEYQREWRQRPENRIYYKVKSFNRNHPDKAVETPLEAKRKYLETGYIPTYIKNDDL